MHPVQQAILKDSALSWMPGCIKSAALCNLRTLSCLPESMNYDLKLPISLQMTSSIRHLSKYAIHNGPRLSSWMAAEVAGETDTFVRKHLNLSFRLMGEVGGCFYSKQVSCLIRHVPSLPDGQVFIPIAFLLDYHPSSKGGLSCHPYIQDEHMLDNQEGCLQENIHRILGEQEVKNYVQLFTWSFLFVLIRFECALECHCQNVCIVFDRPHQTIAGLAYRDFGAVRLLAGKGRELGLLEKSPIVAGSEGDLLDHFEHAFISQLVVVKRQCWNFGSFQSFTREAIAQAMNTIERSESSINKRLLEQFRKRISSPTSTMKSLVKNFTEGEEFFHSVPNILYEPALSNSKK